MNENFYSSSRSNMINGYIKPSFNAHPEVLEILNKVKREDFISKEQKELSYLDTNINIGHGQYMLTPYQEARMLDLLFRSDKHAKVLFIGSGSGYLVSCVAQIANTVVSVELIPELHELARARSKAYAKNINFVLYNALSADLKIESNFDVIILSGSLDARPDILLNRLRDNACMFWFRGSFPMVSAVRTDKINNQYYSIDLFETYAPALLEYSASL